MAAQDRSVRVGYAKGDARREAILDVATEAFASQGFRATSMLQIAATCGISRTGLLHHFASKEDLLAAVLTRRDERGGSGAGAVPDADEDRARLAQLVAVKRDNAEAPGLTQLFSVLSAEAGDPGHPAHAWFVQRYARLRDDLRGTLRRLAERGELVPGTDPGSLATELIALMDGLQVQWLLARDEIDMAGVLRHRVDAALREPLAAEEPGS